MRRYLWVFFFLLVIGCQPSSRNEGAVKSEIVKLDIQGHRGARGLMPENSLPGFKKALELGVSTLELDLAVTSDSQVIVSHEPYMSGEICLDPQGNEISADSALLYNIYKMNYDEVKQFDCGSKVNERFPDQIKIRTYKPLLTEVFDLAEKFSAENQTPLVNFNIELKSMAPYDNIYHPEPGIFSDLVFKVVDNRIPWSNITIQSFDFRVLQYFNETYPEVKLALLIENELSWKENIDSLGFKPAIYSAYYKRHSKEDISELQNNNIQVIPWTVNDSSDMKSLVDSGVDGLITDFPNIAVELFKNK
jgi:glycerophosphoryl diester phosphodiesterase